MEMGHLWLTNSSALYCKERVWMLEPIDACQLVAAARAATAKAFLTSPGGTCYGAAVRTRDGKIYSAGQYSSWNHVTNIHAEQGALLMAAMNDNPDVVALAVASTNSDPVTRPCGVCRQVMKEHVDRIGHDFEVFMAHRYDEGFDRSTVSEILPLSWTAEGLSRSSFVSSQELKQRHHSLRAGEVFGTQLKLGDHVKLVDGSIAMVWDGRFEGLSSLAKLKYTSPINGSRKKIAHSFTEPLKYQAELHELGWARATRLGAAACVIRTEDILERLPSLALHEIQESVPDRLLELLSHADVCESSVRVTGSRAVDLQHQGSDWDLVVSVSPAQIQQIRMIFGESVRKGQLQIPSTSGTWKFLDRLFPGGRNALLSERRFIETVRFGETSVALIFTSHEPLKELLDDSWQPCGRSALHGTVIDDTQVAYKRSVYLLETQSHGMVEVVCFHKAANVLRIGDTISTRGWMLQNENSTRLVQMQPSQDNIVWFAKEAS
jgi:cytidine deaminase/predicted nucleotidyltransferase